MVVHPQTVFSSEQSSSFFAIRTDWEFSKSLHWIHFCSIIPSSVHLTLLLHFSISSQKDPGCTFNILLKNHQISSLTSSTFHKMGEPNSVTFFATFNKDHLSSRFFFFFFFPPVSNNLFLTSIWYLTRMTFNLHISTQILFGITYLFLAKE